MLSKKTKQSIQKNIALHPKDWGSAPVQIALLSKRINDVSDHLKTNKKDLHSRKGLVKLVSKRRKHVKYLEGVNKGLANEVLLKVGLKVKA